MTMKRFLTCVAVPAFLCSQAAAVEIAPDAVKIDEMKVSQSLTDATGNAEEGAKVLANRGLGNCLACHVVTPLAKEQFHGNVAPALDGVADRWSEAELRAIVVDAKRVFSEETVMPAFYSLEVGINVRKDLAGKTILTAQQVEDVVAYLTTLKGSK